jgi:hypothetical protein
MFDQKMQIQKLLGFAENTNDMLGDAKSELTNVSKKLDNVLPQRVDIEQSDPNYPQVFILRDCDAKENEHNFYAMRCQTKSYGSQLKKLKSKYGDNIRRTLTIKQPNAIVFWGSIKKELGNNIDCDKMTNWFSLINITKLEFKQLVMVANTKRLKA